MQAAFGGRLAHLMLARAGVELPVDALGVVAGFVVAVLLELHAHARASAVVDAQPKFLADDFSGQLEVVEFNKVGGEVGHNIKAKKSGKAKMCFQSFLYLLHLTKRNSTDFSCQPTFV